MNNILVYTVFMLKQISKDLAARSWNKEFNNNEWYELLSLFTKIEKKQHSELMNLLALHTGIGEVNLTRILYGSHATIDQLINVLKPLEQQATLRIHAFRASDCFQSLDFTKRELSRTDWNKIIARFNQLQRSKVSINFFLETLSRIKQESIDILRDIFTSRNQPQRQSTKRAYKECTAIPEQSRSKKSYPFFKDSAGLNPLIVNADKVEDPLQAQLENTGVRPTELSPATPQKNQPGLMRTPGKSLVRPVFTVNGATLFKHLTPFSSQAKTDREDLRDVSKEELLGSLPRLNFDKAVTVQFVATLEAIVQRSQTPRRQSQKAIMGASASDV
ncbi:MAG: hypothetical protein PSV35_07025, partial [bacterium]|nr:hypothetical protein [bacterium]